MTVRVLLLNLADTARIRARELGNRRTEEEEGRNRGRRRKKQQNTIGGRFQFVFFIARSSPVDSYIVHYKASWPTKRPMAGDNNFGPKPETVRNGLLPAHSFAIRYRCCRTVTMTATAHCTATLHGRPSPQEPNPTQPPLAVQFSLPRRNSFVYQAARDRSPGLPLPRVATLVLSGK